VNSQANISDPSRDVAAPRGWAREARRVFAEYMSSHRSLANRRVHAIFFVVCGAWVALAIHRHNPLWLLLIAPSFILPHQAHRRIEGNHPATPAMMRSRGFSPGYFVFVHLLEIVILTLFVVEALGLMSLETRGERQ
jgi:hypothetical protein